MDTSTLTFQNKPNNIILIAGVILAFVIPLGLTLWIGNVDISYYDKLFYSRFFYWATVSYLFFYASQFEHQPLLIWTESKPTIGFFLLSVLVLYLLYIAAAIVSSIPLLFGYHESNAMIKKVTQVLHGHQVVIFFVALTAGVTEEFIFRGYMLTRLAQLFKKPYIPIILSSLLFSALHYKWGSLRELIFAFLIGVVFSIYYLKYRNIKAIILTHFLIDFISMNLAQHFKLK